MSETEANREAPVALRRRAYAGVFSIALANLMYEILLTRVFSVTMWHHFAFMAVSLAMFGMTVGALAVYLAPGIFTARNAWTHAGGAALLFAVSVALAFLVQRSIRFVPEISWGSFASLSAIYSVAAVPFAFSGACIALVLTHFHERVGALYAADLLGAAAGCLLLGWFISLTDASTTVLFVALLGGVSAVAFSWTADRVSLRGGAAGTCLAIGALTAWSAVRSFDRHPLIPLEWVKGVREEPPLYEDWNAFSRVTVSAIPPSNPMHVWGLSPAFRGDLHGRQLLLGNDAGGGSYLVGFDGDLAGVEYLKYDIASFAHYLRPNSDVFIVGAGGGRDVLAALAFGQRSVTAVEINGNVVKAVNGPFGEFTGHLDREPSVVFLAEEARSFAARQRKRYGIILFSFVDTYAGTAAGAFALTENSLYTVEAWRTFLQRLEPDGWMSVTRYYFSDLPAEFYRLASLASAALRAEGTSDPRRNIVILRHRKSPSGARVAGQFDIGTLLLRRQAPSAAEIDAIRSRATSMGYEVVVDPLSTADRQFDGVMSAREPVLDPEYVGLDVSPPTDDRPYVNHLLRAGELFGGRLAGRGNLDANRKAAFVLGALLVIVVLLSALCIVAPLVVSRAARRVPARPHVVFFSSIGLGFMLVEIAQMQRLGTFLGHPAYGITVVLFTLLVAGGAGSWFTQRVDASAISSRGRRLLVALVAVLAVLGGSTLPVITFFTPFDTATRVGVAMALLLPAGLFMGMAFPLGMRQAGSAARELTPWLFGINGAASVCSAVLAPVISLLAGISVAYWAGVCAYLGALAAFGRMASDSPGTIETGPPASARRAG